MLARCFTYNQSKYIEDALNGFAIQKTNFPFACLVMDDCSTDGEQEVIKSWMERECDMVKAEYIDLELSNVILVPHKTNENCTFAFYLLKQNLYGTGEKKMKHVTPWREHCEYEAICEGDDYWIIPDKLQKQYDLISSNLSISMVYTNFMNVDEESHVIERKEYEAFADKSKSGNLFAMLMRGNFIITLTIMIRIDVIRNSLYLNCPNKQDYAMFLAAAALGKMYYLDEITGAYRNNNSSLMNSNRQNVIHNNDIIRDYFFKSVYLRDSITLPLSIKDRFVIVYIAIYKGLLNYRLGENSFLRDYLKINPLYFGFVILGYTKLISNRINKLIK